MNADYGEGKVERQAAITPTRRATPPCVLELPLQTPRIFMPARPEVNGDGQAQRRPDAVVPRFDVTRSNPMSDLQAIGLGAHRSRGHPLTSQPADDSLPVRGSRLAGWRHQAGKETVIEA